MKSILKRGIKLLMSQTNFRIQGAGIVYIEGLTVKYLRFYALPVFRLELT